VHAALLRAGTGLAPAPWQAQGAQSGGAVQAPGCLPFVPRSRAVCLSASLTSALVQRGRAAQTSPATAAAAGHAMLVPDR
jgi:hypothetical protein